VGQTIFYSLASEEAASVMETLYELFCRAPRRESFAGVRGPVRRLALP
jgi:hypothetical protein